LISRDLVWGLRFRLQQARSPERLRFLAFLLSYKKGYRIVLWRIGYRKAFSIGVDDQTYRVEDRETYLRVSEILRQISRGVQTEFEFSAGRDVQTDAGTSLDFIGFVFCGDAHRFYFPDDLKNEAPIALRRLFTSRAFSQMRLQGRLVVDVGSFIGDSALYFALRGAQRVVALEPSSRFCSIADVNVEKNGLAGIVQVVNEGAGKSGFSQFAEQIPEGMEDSKEVLIHREWKPGGTTGVRINSLKEVAVRFNPGTDAVLKVNCEGCEYSLILEASEEELRGFSEIMLEYHYGSKKLEKKLGECGFNVLRIQNRLQFNKFFPDPRLEVGLLWARRLSL
jgi:FkbM family methyltransferase